MWLNSLEHIVFILLAPIPEPGPPLASKKLLPPSPCLLPPPPFPVRTHFLYLHFPYTPPSLCMPSSPSSPASLLPSLPRHSSLLHIPNSPLPLLPQHPASPCIPTLSVPYTPKSLTLPPLAPLCSPNFVSPLPYQAFWSQGSQSRHTRRPMACSKGYSQHPWQSPGVFSPSQASEWGRIGGGS